MVDEAVFERDGERFVPGRHAIGPWARDRLHGGPVLGLITRAIEQAEPDPELVLARFTVDLFRPVPAAPLGVRLETLRKGSRLLSLRASVLSSSDGVELAQASALLLRSSAGGDADQAAALPPPAGPDGIATETLMRGAPRSGDRPSGFHTMVETRWVPRERDESLAIWFRLPIALVAGEQASALVCAVALADFANAVPSIAAASRSAGAPFINADTSVYLTRRPEGEWFCLRERSCLAERGISTAQVDLFDQRGAFGHALQARIAVR
jgi:hypothetical protein